MHIGSVIKQRNLSQTNINSTIFQALILHFKDIKSHYLDEADRRIKLEKLKVRKLKYQRKQIELQKKIKEKQEEDMNKQKEENEKLQAKEYQKEIISKAIGTL